jgi:heptosyltransferase-2
MSESPAVLVVAPNWLGDAVMALPAIADVRRHFASARLVVAARRSVAELFHLVPGVDSIVSADPTGVRGAGASTAVLLPNSFASAWLVRRAEIPERWGYAADLRSRLLTRAIRRPRALLHQGAYYQHLVRELGIETGPLEPALSIPADARQAARALLTERGWDDVSPLIVLAPGAAYGKAKQWIPSHVVRLVTGLACDRQVTCALVGSRGDAATTAAIRAAVREECRPRILDLAGTTTLPVLAAILSLSRTCMSNDSGAMHLAAAAGVPVVAIFGSTNERATSPLTRAGVRAEVLTNPVWCRPCMLRECPIDHRCMTGVEPRQVLAAVDRLAEAR